MVTKDRAIEIATTITDEITASLELDHPIRPLQFLISEEEEEEESAEDLDLDEDQTGSAADAESDNEET
jgi:hypothetical protein